MDIVTGIDSPSYVQQVTYTPADLCPQQVCYINTGTQDLNQADTSTTTCSAQNSNVAGAKIQWVQPSVSTTTAIQKQNQVTIDTTQADFDYENYCLSCISLDYFDGAATGARDFVASAPLYSSKVIQVRLVDICKDHWKFTSAHNDYFVTGSGTPASTSPSWEITANYKQSSGGTDVIVIDSSVFGSTTR